MLQPPTAAVTGAPPPAAGVRTPWRAVPAGLRRRVEDRLGAPVVEAANQAGGFSPGVAARVRLADGRRFFVKAVGPEPNPDTPGLHRAEARITAALPASAPVPRLLFSLDRDGWVVLVLEDVDGRTPAQPWRTDELRRVLTAVGDLSRRLDPSPVAVPTLAEACDSRFRGWRRLLTAAHDRSWHDLSWLDPWARRNLPLLAGREAGWQAAASGTALVHGDLRADNVLLTEDRVVVVDWPWAAVGAPWFDVVALAPSVLMHRTAEEAALPLLEAHLTARGAAPEDVTTVLAAVAGYFLSSSGLPSPPGLPTLRGFQRAQGEAALRWLRRRLEPA
ncbi:aminoglycoside phosphotransferase family protein [Streptomyces sp. NPDC005012]|uniref:phosphotransferase family protein n=1 Tax=unclassified Streptomyces TaxID=2593676 RepID=UPI0033B9B1D0